MCLLKNGITFWVVSFPSILWGNISTTFSDSIPYLSSGNYTWSTWDYITNPYIYYLQKEDAVSAVISEANDITRGDYLIGSRVTFWGFPVYLALGINNPGDIVEQDNIPDEPSTDNKIDRRFRFILGSHLGPGVGNLGIGVFFQFRQKRGERVTSREGNRSITYYDGIPNPDRLPTKFGIEIGQKLKGKTDPAWTISLEYRIWGGDTENFREIGREKFTDAPFLFYISENIFPRILSDQVVLHEGNTRREFAFHFLGWWPVPLGYSADVGLDINFYAPFGSGRNSQSIGNSTLDDGTSLGETELTDQILEQNFPLITLSGYGINIKLFYDQDFSIADYGIFRLSPWISYKSVEEKLVEAPVNNEPSDEISVVENEVLLGVDVKLNVFAINSKKLIFYLGWNPRLSLYGNLKAKNIIQGSERSRDSSVPFLRADLTRYALGITYNFFDSFYLHLRAAPETNKVNISRVDVGFDYIFRSSSKSSG